MNRISEFVEDSNTLGLSPANATSRQVPRFELFVRKNDPRLGIFAASFAAHILTNCVSGVPGEDDPYLLATVAAFIDDYPETQAEIARLTDGLNQSVATINYTLQQLSTSDIFE